MLAPRRHTQDSSAPPVVKLATAGDAKPSYDDWSVTVWTATASDAAYDGTVKIKFVSAEGVATQVRLPLPACLEDAMTFGRLCVAY